MAKRSEPSLLTVTLHDAENISSIDLNIILNSTGQFFLVSPVGYGKHRADSTRNSPILIDFHNGHLRVVVYPTIDSNAPVVTNVKV